MFTCCKNNVKEISDSINNTQSLFMLPTGKMACKIIFVDARVTTDVALEWMFVVMAAHVNGVEDIIQKLNITIVALV